MEHLEFQFSGSDWSRFGETGHALAGVVGSGNLEVMIEKADLEGKCLAVVETSIHNFQDTWKEVLGDFVSRHKLSNVRISINDGGATPAVVGLRLDQALEDLKRSGS